MQLLAIVAKAYIMLRQEEEQRDSPKHHPTTPIALNTFKNAYIPPHSYNIPNNPPSNTQNDRRKKLLGYPPATHYTISSIHHLREHQHQIKDVDQCIW